MSGGDLEMSRHRISALLSNRTAYELLPESGKVWFLHFLIVWWLLSSSILVGNCLRWWEIFTGYCIGCKFTSKASVPYTLWAGLAIFTLMSAYLLFGMLVSLPLTVMWQSNVVASRPERGRKWNLKELYFFFFFFFGNCLTLWFY